ncbi:MAG: T9SS type A sorting domain-containing protein [Flavobacteriales bacterium]
MKHYLLCFFSFPLLFAQSANAQVWCPPGAEWWYEHWATMGSRVGFAHVQYASDTVIDGATGQKLEVFVSGYDFIAQAAYYQSLQPIITRSDDQAVSYWDGGQWVLFFDLAISPGGQWALPTNSGSVLVEVQDTGRVEVSGEWLRYSVVDFAPSFGFSTDTIIERIGYKKVFLDPSWTFMLDNDILGLRCYTDGVISYTTDMAPECDFISGVDEAKKQQAIEVYPNPGIDHFTVKWSIPSYRGRMLLYDAMGHSMLDAFLDNERTRVNASMLASGIYAYRIVDGAGRTVSLGRWVKQ